MQSTATPDRCRSYERLKADRILTCLIGALKIKKAADEFRQLLVEFKAPSDQLRCQENSAGSIQVGNDFVEKSGGSGAID